VRGVSDPYIHIWYTRIYHTYHTWICIFDMQEYNMWEVGCGHKANTYMYDVYMMHILHVYVCVHIFDIQEYNRGEAECLHKANTYINDVCMIHML